MAGRKLLRGGQMRVRMGLHTGTPIVAAEGYVGIDVHRGARIAALAHGGQVLLTEATAALLADVTLTDLGHHRLKDFDGPAHLFQLGQDAFPALRTPGAVHLPMPATRLESDASASCSKVSRLSSSVTRRFSRSSGPAALARRASRSSLRGCSLTKRTVAPCSFRSRWHATRRSYWVRWRSDSARRRLTLRRSPPASEAGGRTSSSTTLSSCFPTRRASLASLADAAPSLRLLVTSREALGVTAETRFDLPPLNADESVALFLERARRVREDVPHTPAIDALCDRLDRLPLALELAAALEPPPGARGAPPPPIRAARAAWSARRRPWPPRPYGATIEWSYDLLSDEGTSACLPGSRSTTEAARSRAAEQVCEADLGTLASLIDKSLLRRRFEGGRLRSVLDARDDSRVRRRTAEPTTRTS